MAKSFYTLFTRAENVHLIKDVGMVPYILHRDYGYASVLATYKNAESYPYLESEVSGLKVSFIPKVFKRRNLNMALYIFKNFRKIDALQMYHFEIDQIDLLGLYMILRKMFFLKFFTYIKCDGSDRFTNTDFEKVKFASLRKKIIANINLYTVETTVDFDIIKEIDQYKALNLKIMYNGFDDDGNKINLQDIVKQKVILTVGRLGTHQKNTEFLLEAFKTSGASADGWRLCLAGPIEDNFKIYLNDFLKKNPLLRDKIEVLGNVTDRDQLRSLYSKASVFILTSRAEGSPLVVPEALANGCYCLFSEAIKLKSDIISNSSFGKSFSIDNVNELSSIFDSLSVIDYNSLKFQIQGFAYSSMYWKNNLSLVNTEIASN